MAPARPVGTVRKEWRVQTFNVERSTLNVIPCPSGTEEGAFLGGTWHPDSPSCVDVPVNFRRIGVPGILDGERTDGQGATNAMRSMTELHRAHLPLALPE